MWRPSGAQLGAWWIAARVEGKESEEDSPEKYLATPKYVDEQYSGKRNRSAHFMKRSCGWPRRSVLMKKRVLVKRSFRYTGITSSRSSSLQQTLGLIWAFRSLTTKESYPSGW